MDAIPLTPATPEPAGNVVLIAPVPCGMLAVRTDPPGGGEPGAGRPGGARDEPTPFPILGNEPMPSAEPCKPPVLRSGSFLGTEFVALLAFDLRALPAGSELLYAGLELAGLDDAFLGEVGQWVVRAVTLPQDVALGELSFARILAAPAVAPGFGWQLGRAELAPGGRNTLKLGGEGLRYLAEQLGQGSVAFRIEGPRGQTNLFGWEARGPGAPRLRIAYNPARSVTETPPPLIVWDATSAAADSSEPEARATAGAGPVP